MSAHDEFSRLREACWNKLVEYCYHWERIGQIDCIETKALAKEVIDFENSLMWTDLGFSSCAMTGVPDNKRKGTVTCMRRRFDGTVEEVDSSDIELQSLVHFRKPGHIVFRGIVERRLQEPQAVHAYHTPDSISGKVCPHDLVREGAGRVQEKFVVPMHGFAWGEKSHVLWIIEPWCQVPTTEEKKMPEFAASRDYLFAQCPVVNTLRLLKLGTEFLYHGDICYRQRRSGKPKGMCVKADNPTIYTKAYPVMDDFWRGGQPMLPFQRSDESFRQLCGGANKDIVERVIKFMHNVGGTTSTVYLRAFYRSVQLFGYWWATRYPEELQKTLDSFFPSDPELSRRLVELKDVGNCGFRLSSRKPYLAANVLAPNGIQRALIVFDPDSGKFFDHDDESSELFESPYACLLARYRKEIELLKIRHPEIRLPETGLLDLHCVSPPPPPQHKNQYQNK